MAEELNTLLKGHDFALCCQDSRCPTGRVRWLGFNVALGKVGVAAVKWDKTSTGKTFVVALDLLRNACFVDKPTDERVALALTSLQELVKKRSKFISTLDDDDGCDYTPKLRRYNGDQDMTVTGTSGPHCTKKCTFS